MFELCFYVTQCCISPIFSFKELSNMKFFRVCQFNDSIYAGSAAILINEH